MMMVYYLWEEPGGVTPEPTTKPTPTPTPTNPKVITGDLDRSGDVDSIDFALFRCRLLGIPHPEIDMEAADVNGDGEVDALDFGAIRRYLLGIVKTLP